MNRFVSAVAVSLTLALSGAVIAGPLTPPSGPISSTGKTLTQIEPRIPLSDTTTPGDGSANFVISQPGSYYLAGNVTATKNVGIDIRASHVTLDLNGFTVSKGAGASTEYGILCATDGQDTFSNVTVRNGSVVGGFNEQCVFVETRGAVVEDIRVVGSSTSWGITISYDGVARRCFARSCVTGIVGGSRSTVENCTVTDCSNTGISVGFGTVRDCLVTECDQQGIVVYGDAVVEHNTLRDNATGNGSGILVNGVGARIENNTISRSWFGIFLASSATDTLVVRNTVRKGGGSAIGMQNQVAGVYPNNHVAAMITDPASPFTTTNPLANIQY